MGDDKNEFTGDVLMVCTPDGGDIVIEDGLVKPCRNFDTAVYLSLFGGNEHDRNGKASETWWGNLVPGTRRNEWMQSEFGSVVTSFPFTSGNLKKAADAAERDLEWLKTDAGADSIEVSLEAESAKRVKLTANIMKDSSTIGGGEYETQWQEELR